METNECCHDVYENVLNADLRHKNWNNFCSHENSVNKKYRFPKTYEFVRK